MATHRILAWKIHGQNSLVGYSPWAYKESDTTEHMHARVCTHTHKHCYFRFMKEES